MFFQNVTHLLPTSNKLFIEAFVFAPLPRAKPPVDITMGGRGWGLGVSVRGRFLIVAETS